MNTKDINEHQSLRVIHAIARVYRATSPQSRQIVRDIDHVIAAYELHDKEAALACNRYIITKYPILYKVAPRYGLHPMTQNEFSGVQRASYSTRSTTSASSYTIVSRNRA